VHFAAEQVIPATLIAGDGIGPEIVEASSRVCWASVLSYSFVVWFLAFALAVVRTCVASVEVRFHVSRVKRLPMESVSSRLAWMTLR
jgi:hypothetical protein